LLVRGCRRLTKKMTCSPRWQRTSGEERNRRRGRTGLEETQR
jgi:hypothetical protein